MEIIPIKIENISPVNYYYIAASGGMRSSTFIGDIALKYSTLKQMGELDYPSPTKFKPTYEELNDFDFWFTVGISEKLAKGEGKTTQFMKNMTRNTMHGIDYNGTNKYPNAREGSTMYKNFYFQQPLLPGNVFYSYLISKENMDFPKVLRVGTGKTGVLKLSKMSASENIQAVLNRYSIENIMGKKITHDGITFSEHLVLQYFLIGMYSMSKVGEIYEKWLH